MSFYLPSLPSKAFSLSIFVSHIAALFAIYIKLTLPLFLLSSSAGYNFKKMCLKSSKPQPLHTQRMRSASYHKKYNSKIQTHLRIFNLTRRRKLLRDEENEMEMRNLKLFVENQSIIRENEALKKKALLLLQENNALFVLLHPKLSSVSTSSLN